MNHIIHLKDNKDKSRAAKGSKRNNEKKEKKSWSCTEFWSNMGKIMWNGFGYVCCVFVLYLYDFFFSRCLKFILMVGAQDLSRVVFVSMPFHFQLKHFVCVCECTLQRYCDVNDAEWVCVCGWSSVLCINYSPFIPYIYNYYWRN